MSPETQKISSMQSWKLQLGVVELRHVRNERRQLACLLDVPKQLHADAWGRPLNWGGHPRNTRGVQLNLASILADDAWLGHEVRSRVTSHKQELGALVADPPLLVGVGW